MTIINHYFKRTFFGKLDILFAIGLPLAIIHIMYFVNMQMIGDGAAEILYILGINLATYISIQLAAMFTFDTGTGAINLLYKDLKNQGIRDRLLVAPVVKNSYILGIVASTLLFIILCTTVILLVSSITIGAVYENLLLLSVTFIVSALLGVTLNIFNFYICKNEKTAKMASNIAMFQFLGLNFVGGTGSEGGILSTLSYYSPITLSINAIGQESYIYVLYLGIWVLVLGILSLIIGKRKPI